VLTYSLSHKKAIKEPIDTQKAKDFELDEQPKPTRKISHPAIPIGENEESSTHDRKKGRTTNK
jgi:hypothetical protein